MYAYNKRELIFDLNGSVGFVTIESLISQPLWGNTSLAYLFTDSAARDSQLVHLNSTFAHTNTASANPNSARKNANGAPANANGALTLTIIANSHTAHTDRTIDNTGINGYF